LAAVLCVAQNAFTRFPFRLACNLHLKWFSCAHPKDGTMAVDSVLYRLVLARYVIMRQW
jgi:hypothetical protein